MAQGMFPTPSTNEVFITDCKGNVFCFNENANSWMEIGEAHVCRVMLYQYGDRIFKLVARQETSEAKVTLNLTLRYSMIYEVVSEQWHQLKVDSRTLFGFKFLIECNPRNFAVVMQSLLKAVQVTSPPTPPPQVFPSYGTYPRSLASPGGAAMYPPYRDMNLRQDFNVMKLDYTEEQRDSRGDLCQSLTSAISEGDERKAVDIVKKLCDRKASVIIGEGKRGIRKPKDLHKDLSLSVQVEDKDCSGARFRLHVTPATTVHELKEIVYSKYNLPCQVQKWIIGKKITKNEDTLMRLNITTSGATVFLYLMSAKDVGFKHLPYKSDSDSRTGDVLKQLTNISPSSLPDSNTGHLDIQSISNTDGLNTPQPSQHIEPQIQENVVELDTIMERRPAQNLPALFSSNEGLEPSIGPNVVLQQSRSEPLVLEDVLPVELVEPQGWTCPVCTYINPPTRPGCYMCASNRPEDYVVPEDVVLDENEKQRLQCEQFQEILYKEAEEQKQVDERIQARRNFEELLETASKKLIPNTEEFDCTICYTPVEVGEGVVLRECLHSFCRDCLVETIRNSEEAEVQCPFQDELETCHTVITGQEVNALLSPEDFEKFLRRSLVTAESQAANSFHCKSANCPGWCLYEDNVNTFNCPVCGEPNCLTCKVQHPNMDCKEYQEDLKRRAQNDEAAKQTQQFLEEMIQKGEALNCPRCKIVLLKKDGCDWMRCSMCKLEICWATRGPRWGPNGNGDISGGCRCRVGGKKCHPKCRNCH